MRGGGNGGREDEILKPGDGIQRPDDEVWWNRSRPHRPREL